MAPFDPLLAHGIREATGTERPAPGILCWNCHKLSPFPSKSCKWCRAAFAGTAGGTVPDAIPEQTVRGPLSVPNVVPTVRPRRRIVRPFVDPGPSAEAPRREGPVARPQPPPATSVRGRGPLVVSPSESPRSTLPSKSMALAECPVCGRAPHPGAQGCVCGAVFGDATTTVNCAECGSVIPIEAHRCFVCGLTFGGGGGATTYACPLCGLSVDEAASVCACGARFAE